MGEETGITSIFELRYFLYNSHISIDSAWETLSLVPDPTYTIDLSMYGFLSIACFNDSKCPLVTGLNEPPNTPITSFPSLIISSAIILFQLF